jgi:hypothetical protein
MAKRNLVVQGVVVALPAAVTVLVDGKQVFSGQVTGKVDEFVTNLFSFDFDAESANAVINVSVTSGIVKVAEMFVDGKDPRTKTESTRKNILINGQAPEYPAFPVADDHHPGDESDPHWAGWAFELSAGETLTCTVAIPE